MTSAWFRSPWTVPALILAACVLAHLGSITHPFFLDDAYELNRGLDGDWHRWLFAWNYDVPNSDTPWWWGVAYQRGVVRVVPSALFAAEVRVFGYDPLGYHLVTVAFIAGTGIVIQRVLAAWTKDVVAATAATLAVVVHPSVGEIIAFVNSQPLAMCAFAVAVSTACWTSLRQTGSRRALVGALVAAFLALTSYEAVIGLPLLVVGLDVWLLRGKPEVTGGRWRPRLAMLGLFVLYIPLVKWVHSGVTAPDYEAMRPLGVVWHAFHVDTLSYLAKELGLFDPHDQFNYWLLQRVGPLVALAILAVPIGALLYFGRDRRLTAVGLASFAVLFAPPVLVRATVSILNLPTFRQLFFPTLFGLSVLLAALAVGRVGRGRIAALAAVALFGLVSLVQNVLISTVNERRDGVDRVMDRVTELLAGEDPSKTLVLVGNPVCGFYPSFVWRGPIVRAFPGARDPREDVALSAEDDHTLLGRTKSGFSAVLVDKPQPWPSPPGSYHQGPLWIVRQPNFTPEHPIVTIDGGTVEVAERDGPKVKALRAKLAQPLSRSIVIWVRGCAAAQRVDLK